jgi:hypothetical protein
LLIWLLTNTDNELVSMTDAPSVTLTLDSGDDVAIIPPAVATRTDAEYWPEDVTRYEQEYAAGVSGGFEAKTGSEGMIETGIEWCSLCDVLDRLQTTAVEVV